MTPPATIQDLRDTASHMVSLVTRNRHYLSILKWECTICKTINKATTTCSFCPPDPFQNSPLITLLGKSFEQFFKELVQLVATNPPTNYAPETLTNYKLIEICLTSHGVKWGKLLSFDQKSPYNCNCSKPPPTATFVEIPRETHPFMDSE